MQKLELALKFMTNMFWGLFLEGLLATIIGILIFVYPDLLGMLVGILFIAGGIILFLLAFKVKKYSKFKIEL
jgi:uncharacterized membrane protein HdeD (DUF308 family)